MCLLFIAAAANVQVVGTEGAARRRWEGTSKKTRRRPGGSDALQRSRSPCVWNDVPRLANANTIPRVYALPLLFENPPALPEAASTTLQLTEFEGAQRDYREPGRERKQKCLCHQKLKTGPDHSSARAFVHGHRGYFYGGTSFPPLASAASEPRAFSVVQAQPLPIMLSTLTVGPRLEKNQPKHAMLENTVPTKAGLSVGWVTWPILPESNT